MTDDYKLLGFHGLDCPW